MRTCHADLITAQQSGAADPYIYIYINSTDYTSRLISLEHIEEPYRDRATIVLANSDRHFNDNDLRGDSFPIGYGYTDANSINRYLGDGLNAGYNPAMPTMEVKSQSMVSMEGELVCILYCEGGWMKLREFHFITTGEDPPYLNISFTATQTVFELIELALEEAGFTLNAIGDHSDGIIDTYNPIFTANPLEFESPARIIYRLIQMTMCFIRQVESLAFEIVYPQTSDSVNETYYSDTAPYFKEYVEKLNLVLPNSIVVYCNMSPDGSWDVPGYSLITGTASDTDLITAYEEVINYFEAPYIGNQTDADNRAEAILARLKAESLAGRVVLPFHDCRVELYDRVEIDDNRGT